jgi:hypothetical protein
MVILAHGTAGAAQKSIPYAMSFDMSYGSGYYILQHQPTEDIW